jgi:hypothetical protein
MPSRKHLPKPDRRRALELLASCRDGCTEALMRAHGFTIPQMVEVRAGLATATAERVVAGGKTIEVARVRITEAGRRTHDGCVMCGEVSMIWSDGPSSRDFMGSKKGDPSCLTPSPRGRR